MESKIVAKNKPSGIYPVLKAYDRDGFTTVVLFIGPGTGTCLLDTKNIYEMGSYDNCWTEDNFVVMRDQLVLEN